MKKLSGVVLSCVLVLSMFAGLASAHVTVQPSETTQGAYELFTVRVPSEKSDTPTVKVEVHFPEGVTVSRFEPIPGWEYDVQESDDGRIEGVVWTAEGDGLAPIEFARFHFQGRVDEEATELIWKAYQTYGNGEVVEWVGARGSATPASVTIARPREEGQAMVHDHGHEMSTPNVDQEPTTSAVSNGAPLYLSIAALAIGLLSLGLTLKRKA